MGICSLCHRYNVDTISGVCGDCIGKNRVKNRKKKNLTKIILASITIAIAVVLVYENLGVIQNNATHTEQAVVKQLPNLTKQISAPIQNLVPKIIKTISKTPSLAQPQNTQTTYSLEQLDQVALGDINNYRQQNGLSKVPLDNAKASQVWANHLLSLGCITHREGNTGPIQRYLDNGDKLQMVFENVAGGSGTSWMSPVDAIKQANSNMMFNDADQGNGHRDNILNPEHNSVSIGIAYNSDKLVLVEDFQEPIGAYDWKSFDLSYDASLSCW